MNKKKTIITAVVLLAVLLVGGLLAYFQDTDTKTNVFTLGNVNIQLNEADWTAVSGSTTNEFERAEAKNITPNKTIAKAPIVKNIGNDETGHGNGNDAYVFVKVEVPQADLNVIGGTNGTQDIYTLNNKNANWTEITNDVTPAPAAGTHIYVYKTTTETGALTRLTYGQETPEVFESVTLKNVLEPASYGNNFNIKVTAYGIQADDLSETTPAGIFGLFRN